jgi:thiamine-phosphate pyrophosphorylase
MDEQLSLSAQRAIDAASGWARRAGSVEVGPAHLILAVAEQEESRAAAVLSEFGVTLDRLRAALGSTSDEVPDYSQPFRALGLSEVVRKVLSRARSWSGDRPSNSTTGTDAILLELLDVAAIRQSLSLDGVDAAAIAERLRGELQVDERPLAAEFETLRIGDATDSVDIFRILDACSNRAREGLRVLEDFARFARDDPFLSAQFKELRHDLRTALDALPREALLASRDTQSDVGTQCTAAMEFVRTDTLDVVVANFKRTQEALRSLEEFGKLQSRPLSEAIETVRYRLYSLERVTLQGIDSQQTLDGVVLYALVSADQCAAGLEWTVSEAIGGGVQVIQLREKSLSDRAYVESARRLREVTRRAGALFIVNDRPDIARLVDADGVHVGQEELTVKDARRIVGPRGLVGVSTHSIEQARQAVLDGANYIGMGPTFPSTTKTFAEFPGLDLIQQVAAEIRLPAFAIGGITCDRVASVLAAGARRVAVTAAICGAEDPRQSAAALRSKLQAIE